MKKQTPIDFLQMCDNIAKCIPRGKYQGTMFISYDEYVKLKKVKTQ